MQPTSSQKACSLSSKLQVPGGRYKTRTCGGLTLRVRLRAVPRACVALKLGHKFESPVSQTLKKPAAFLQSCRFLVDDTRLELVTSRTSSGCATSCANRPCCSSKAYFISISSVCQEVFSHFSQNRRTSSADSRIFRFPPQSSH